MKEGKYRLLAVGQWESKPQKSLGENSWSTSPTGYLPSSHSASPPALCNFLFLFCLRRGFSSMEKSRSQAEKPIVRSLDFSDFFITGCSSLWRSVYCLHNMCVCICVCVCSWIVRVIVWVSKRYCLMENNG